MGRRNLARINDTLFENGDLSCATGSGSYQERILRRALVQAWEHVLTPHQKKYMDCYYRQHMNLSDIAQAEAVSVSAVCRTLSRARKRLGKILQYYIIQ